MPQTVFKDNVLHLAHAAIAISLLSALHTPNVRENNENKMCYILLYKESSLSRKILMWLNICQKIPFKTCIARYRSCIGTKDQCNPVAVRFRCSHSLSGIEIVKTPRRGGHLILQTHF